VAGRERQCGGRYHGTRGLLHLSASVDTVGLLLDNGVLIRQKSAAGVPQNLLTHYSDDNVYLDNRTGAVSIRTGSLASTMWLGANGNVGVGTASPGSKLDVAGDINLSGSLLCQGGPVLELPAPTAGGNVALGLQALRSNTTGTNNTAVGSNALFLNTTGGASTATGWTALQQNTTGYSNTATGRAAMHNNASGAANTATGDSALGSNTTGNQNTATGSAALGLNTTGTYNTADGQGALYNNSTGSTNTAIGAGALANNTTGSNNIAIGTNAASNVAAGNNNVHIGSTGVSADNGVIRIGTLGIQTSLFDAGIRGVTTGKSDALPVVVDSAGQLGTGGALVNSQWTNGTGGAISYSGGNVGIGATAPSAALDVVGDINFSGSLRYQGVPIVQVSGTSLQGNNLGLGPGALRNNTTGYQNTASGYALWANTTGNQNTATGFQGLFSNVRWRCTRTPLGPTTQLLVTARCTVMFRASPTRRLAPVPWG